MTRPHTVTRVLVIEDDLGVKLALYKTLINAGYEVVSAKTGSSGIKKAENQPFDIILLDLGLPDMSGFSVCRQLRAEGIEAPIIVLTGESSTGIKVQLLDAGASDYVTKPFSAEELLARIRTRLRYISRRPISATLFVGDLRLSLDERTAERSGVTIHLRRKECDILAYLMQYAGSTVSREDIMHHVWDTESWTNAVDVHVKHLRDKIDRPFDRPLIRTIHGMGYRLETNRRTR